MYDDLVKLIERSAASFPQPGHGVSPATIEAAERALGIPLPTSYKWWLSTYGQGEIGGDILYGLDEDYWGAPDLVTLYQDDQRDCRFPERVLVFYIGNEELYYFDARHGLDDHEEYPVYYLDTDTDEPEAYAERFAAFLARRINEVYGERR